MNQLTPVTKRPTLTAETQHITTQHNTDKNTNTNADTDTDTDTDIDAVRGMLLNKLHQDNEKEKLTLTLTEHRH